MYKNFRVITRNLMDILTCTDINKTGTKQLLL